LRVCERELAWLDMAINFKKSCMYSNWSPLRQNNNGTLYSKTGYSTPWVTEMRYLGIYFVQSRKLKCSLDAAKRGFYRAVNSIFSKIGRTASEEVILQIISSKCMAILMYGLEALPLQTRGQSNLTKSASRGAHSPVRGHPRGSKVVPLNSWGRVSY